MAKAYAGDAGFRVTASALQVHGGIGFTWEHDLHFFLKRATRTRTRSATRAGTATGWRTCPESDFRCERPRGADERAHGLVALATT